MSEPTLDRDALLRIIHKKENNESFIGGFLLGAIVVAIIAFLAWAKVT